MGTSLVLEQDGVGGQAHRRAIEEDHRHPVVDLPLQELVVLAGAGDQQAVDPAADEAVDDVPLPPWIVVGAHGDQQMPLGERGVLDEAGDRRVERVGHVGDDETDRRRPGCPTQRARPIVTAVAEHAHGSLHAGGDVVAHEWLLVDDSRDGLDAHTGDRGDVLEGGATDVVSHRAKCRQRRPDNVVIRGLRASPVRVTPSVRMRVTVTARSHRTGRVSVIRGLLAFIVVFLLATLPATWLLMLFFGNVGVVAQLLGHVPARHPRVRPVGRRDSAEVRGLTGALTRRSRRRSGHLMSQASSLAFCAGTRRR